MVNFADLDAMDDADWDKVFAHVLSFEPPILIPAVLEYQRQEQLLSFQSCFAQIQCQPRGRCLYHHFVNCCRWLHDIDLFYWKLMSQQNRVSPPVVAACHMPSLRELVGFSDSRYIEPFADTHHSDPPHEMSCSYSGP